MTTPRDSLMFFLLLLSSFFPLLTQPIPRLLKSIALAAIVYSTLQHGPPPPPPPPSPWMSNSVLGAHQNNKRINFPTETRKNKNGENRLMMINEGAIRASNCNPISFQTLPTICGLLTRNGGGCPPPILFLTFLQEWSSASGQLRSQQLSLLFSLCLPVCLLAVHVPLSTNLTPKKHKRRV
jgi:hypothetical protein